MVKYLLLDWDDTLWDFSANSALALNHCYSSMGLHRFFASEASFRDGYYRANDALWASYRGGSISRDYLVAHRFYDTLAAAGCRDMDLAQRVNNAYLASVETWSQLVPYAREVIEYLREKGYVLIVVTNGFREPQMRKLRNSGLSHLLDYFVVSADAGAMKPSRQFFDYVMEHTGAVPQESILIGDDAESDIAGAKACGMGSVYFNRRNIPCPYKPDYEISNLIQLKEIL